MLLLAAVSHGGRRAALTDAVTEAAFAAAGFSQDRSHRRARVGQLIGTPALAIVSVRRKAMYIGLGTIIVIVIIVLIILMLRRR